MLFMGGRIITRITLFGLEFFVRLSNDKDVLPGEVELEGPVQDWFGELYIQVVFSFPTSVEVCATFLGYTWWYHG